MERRGMGDKLHAQSIWNDKLYFDWTHYVKQYRNEWKWSDWASQMNEINLQVEKWERDRTTKESEWKAIGERELANVLKMWIFKMIMRNKHSTMTTMTQNRARKHTQFACTLTHFSPNPWCSFGIVRFFPRTSFDSFCSQNISMSPALIMRYIRPFRFPIPPRTTRMEFVVHMMMSFSFGF